MSKFLTFLRKQDLLGLFEMQGLEHIFPRQDHIDIFSKLLLNCTMDTFMLSKTDNKNLSSAKRVIVEEILLLRSFKYTLDRKGSVR